MTTPLIPRPKHIRVLPADDHPMMTAVLRSEMIKRPNIILLPQVFSLEDVLPAIERERADVVFLDAHMPHSVGEPSDSHIASILIDLTTSHPLLGIIVLTGYDNPIFFKHALQAGVHGIILKTEDPALCLAALDRVMVGNTYLSPAAQAMIDNPNNLTDLQIDLLRLMAQGHSTNKIAQQMNTSSSNVRQIQCRLRERFQVATNEQLIAVASQANILYGLNSAG